MIRNELLDAIYKTNSHYLNLCAGGKYSEMAHWKKEDFVQAMNQQFNTLSYNDQIEFYYHIKKVFHIELSSVVFSLLDENQQLAAVIME